VKQALAYVGLIVAMALWGGSFVAQKIALFEYSPYLVIAGRMVIGSIAFIIMWPAIKPNVWYWRDLKLLIPMALFEPCFYFLFETNALRYTTAGQASLIVATLPLMVGVSAAALKKIVPIHFSEERLSVIVIAGLLISVCGVFLLTYASVPSTNSPNPALGNFLEFMAMLMSTGYALIVRFLCDRYGAFFLTAVGSFVGAIFFVPLFLFFDDSRNLVFKIEPMLAILYLGLGVTVFAYAFYNYGIANTSATKASAIANTIPVFALFLDWLFMGETLNEIQMLGVVLIGIGVLMSQNIKFMTILEGGFRLVTR